MRPGGPRCHGPALLAGAGVAATLAVLVGGTALPPTQDGPAHVYTAYVERSLEEPGSPFRHAFTVDEGLRPNRLTSVLLRVAGPPLGWRTAERLVMGLSVGGVFLGLLLAGRRLADRAPGVASVAVTGWLAQPWFLWKGFYDFGLGAALLTLVVALLAPRKGGWRTHLGLQLLFVALFFAHLFMLGVAALVVGITLLTGVVTGRRSARELVALLTPAALLGWATFAGVLGDAAPRWISAWPERFQDLLRGEVLVSYLPAAAVAGVAVTAVVVHAGLLAWRVPSGEGRTGPGGRSGPQPGRYRVPRALRPVFLAAAALALLSVAVPDVLGAGGFLPERLRYVALLVGACGIVATGDGGRRGRWLRGAAASVCLVLLALQAGEVLREAGELADDHADLRAALSESGAAPGTAVLADLAAGDADGRFIRPYLHLVDRSARELKLVDVETYTARSPAFSLRWRTPPPSSLVGSFGVRRGGLTETMPAWGWPLLIVRRLPVVDLPSPGLRSTEVGESGPYRVVRVEPATASGGRR